MSRIPVKKYNENIMIYNIIQTASRFESQVIERLFVEMSICWCI